MKAFSWIFAVAAMTAVLGMIGCEVGRLPEIKFQHAAIAGVVYALISLARSAVARGEK